MLIKWILAFIVCSPVWAYKMTQDFSGGFYWSTLPITITVVESDPVRKSILEKISKKAIADWEHSTGLKLWNFTSTMTSPASTNIVRWSNNFAAETNMDPYSVLAVAIRYVDGPYFAKTEIVINGNHELNKSEYFLRTTLTHEFGHTMGLDHSEDSSAVMAPTLQLHYNGLTQDDSAGMEEAYQVMEHRQVTGYISPLTYSRNEQKGQALSCGTVGVTPGSSLGLNAGISLATGMLISMVRKLAKWLKSLF